MTRLKHGVEEEPLAIFIGRNILMAVVTVYVGYLLAMYRGLPMVLMSAAITADMIGRAR